MKPIAALAIAAALVGAMAAAPARAQTKAPPQAKSAQTEADHLRCTRRYPPLIGSTYGQVMATCWGRIYYKVNRTITAAGTREQHVYPYSSPTAEAAYLYYQNGILVAIQR